MAQYRFVTQVLLKSDQNIWRLSSCVILTNSVVVLQITQLKIDNNPFAKGFRDSGGGKREKK
jgi:T-box